VGVIQKEQNRQVENLEEQLSQKADVQDLDGLREGMTNNGSRLGTAERTLGALAQDLGVARSELGEIETNTQQQLQTLQETSEGEYHEFTLRKNRPLHLGHIGLTLRKTNLRKQIFSLDVLANDQDIRHAGHNVDEPIYFCVGQSRTPYELVVTSVGAEDVTGYLRIPKVASLPKEPAPRT